MAAKRVAAEFLYGLAGMVVAAVVLPYTVAMLLNTAWVYWRKRES